jgi:hypothetical protein
MLPAGRIPFAVAFFFTAILQGQVSVLTWHNDTSRTGQNLAETILTPLNVSNTDVFGKLFVISVDGKVDAEPLYVPSLAIPSKGTHNVLYVVTENDSAYAFDADTGTQLWKVSAALSGEGPSDDRGCTQVTPQIGITSTPVIDLQSGPHGTIYLVAMSKDASGNYYQRLHALDLTTGSEEFSGPMTVAASWPGTGDASVNGTVPFDPKQYKERAALLLYGGVVYTTWASHCDAYPYTGWMMGFSESTLARVSLINLTPNGGDGAMWNAGAGPAVDASGSLYVMTANGTFDPTLNSSGFPSGGDYGNSFVRLVLKSGALTVADYFTMYNTVSESNGDVDLGSGGFLLIPTVDDAQGHPRSLLAGAGKDAHLYVVDRNNMGKFNPSLNGNYQDLTGAIGGSYSSPAWFNGTLYYGAVSDNVKAFPLIKGEFSANPASKSPTALVYPGATPSISANGTENAIVWAAENTGTATLHAYDATNLATELYNTNMASGGRDQFGTGNKFIVPMIANGKVYVGTTSGIGVFGLFCSGALSANAHVVAGGGGGTVTVTVPTGCNWTAQTNSSFISLTSSAGGTGNGSVSYTVAANTDAPRTGTLSIAGQTFTITQDGLPLSFVPMTPCRLVDTRASNGAFGSPSLVAGTAREFVLPDSTNCSVPSTAEAYSLNVTVVPKGDLSYLTVWASGQTQPVTSTLNSLDGRVKANAAIVAAGTSGGVSVFATNATDLVLDIDGYFVSASGNPSALAFYPLAPCRLADTRSSSYGSLGSPSLSAGAQRTFAILSSACSVPGGAQAYSLNFTAVPSGALGYLTAFPTGQTKPLASTLNAPTGTITANAAIVQAGSSGSVDVYTSSATNLVIDINGYFGAPGTGGLSLYNLTPCRVVDTRQLSTTPFSGEMDVNVTASGCGALAAAQAYVFNATVVPSGPLGFLTLWPQGGTEPLVSTLNALDGAVTSNMAIVPTSNGSIAAEPSSATQLVLDIFGYFAP